MDRKCQLNDTRFQYITLEISRTSPVSIRGHFTLTIKSDTNLCNNVMHYINKILLMHTFITIWHLQKSRTWWLTTHLYIFVRNEGLKITESKLHRPIPSYHQNGQLLHHRNNGKMIILLSRELNRCMSKSNSYR